MTDVKRGENMPRDLGYELSARQFRYGVAAYESPRGPGALVASILRSAAGPIGPAECWLLCGYYARCASATPDFDSIWSNC